VARYTKASRDRVRDAVDFAELVQARTELRRAGPARYEGLCPFHDERTPSFGIDPQQKVYYCFGCQASGDVFTFVQETEGVDFKGALELLAERTGVELEREEEDPRDAEKRRKRERLLELLDRTAGYYERYLWESKEAAKARAYLAERGLGEAALREFRVGYAPSAWDKVMLASRRGRYSNVEIYEAGLVQRSRQNGQLYDRFRSRIMFPLADVRGRVLGFGARAVSPEQQPKYLNTADNDVYHKGLHLYGAHLARAHAARAGRVILCEGYTDVIAMHQAGLREAVGLMGTALTVEQVGELGRIGQTVLLALDSDTAGQEAMLRAAGVAARRKLDLRVVPMPAGLDPAELIAREGVEAMRAAVEASVPFVRFRVEQTLAAGDDRTPEGRDRTLEALRPVFAELPASAMRMELTRIVSSRLAVPEGAIERVLAQGGPPGRATRFTRPAEGNRPPGVRGGELVRHEDMERAFLALCLAEPDEGERVLAELDTERLLAGELTRRAARHLRDGGLTTPLADVDGERPLEEDAELTGLLAELIVEAGREQGAEGMVGAQLLQLELASLDREIARARVGRGPAGQAPDIAGLARRKAEVKREFESVIAQVLEATGAREE
jgi:DNA primase